METKIVDYEKEFKKLEEFLNVKFWNPKPGKHTIVILSEMENYQFVDKKTQTIEPRAKVLIEINKEPFVWSFGIGKTKASAYGQLVERASQNNNKLTGLMLTVVVKNDGSKNDYTIV